MKKAKFTIEQINVGDEVYFESTRLQSNHDFFWTVIGKQGDKVMVELKMGGFPDNFWTINISEVVYLTPKSKQ